MSSSIRSEGYKTLARGDRYLPRTNTKGPIRSGLEFMARIVVPLASAIMAFIGVMEACISFKENFSNKRK